FCRGIPGFWRRLRTIFAHSSSDGARINLDNRVRVGGRSNLPGASVASAASNRGPAPKVNRQEIFLDFKGRLPIPQIISAVGNVQAPITHLYNSLFYSALRQITARCSREGRIWKNSMATKRLRHLNK